MLWYEEVFATVQGEGSSSGKPCVFVRLHGCNVGCSYCDQPQTKDTKKRIGAGRLASLVLSYHIPRVCITGGEPLLQPEIYVVVYELIQKGLEVSIETSGCVPLESDAYVRKYNYVMDIKCPSSGVVRKNVYENLAKLQVKDEVKFVVADRKDYDFARDIMRKYPTNAKILFSPVMKLNSEGNWVCTISQDLVKWILEDRLTNVRVQVQLHKFLGVK